MMQPDKNQIVNDPEVNVSAHESRKVYVAPTYRGISIAENTESAIKTATDGLQGKGLS